MVIDVCFHSQLGEDTGKKEIQRVYKMGEVLMKMLKQTCVFETKALLPSANGVYDFGSIKVMGTQPLFTTNY